jgi:hypothetical protein
LNKLLRKFLDELPKNHLLFLESMQRRLLAQRRFMGLREDSMKTCILLEDEVIEADIMIFAIWKMRYPNGHIIANDKIRDVEISTVFLPIAIMGMYFETMCFMPDDFKVTGKYTTSSEAKEGHAKICAEIHHDQDKSRQQGPISGQSMESGEGDS